MRVFYLKTKLKMDQSCECVLCDWEVVWIFRSTGRKMRLYFSFLPRGLSLLGKDLAVLNPREITLHVLVSCLQDKV